MEITKLHQAFRMNVPIKDVEWWNGIPATHELSNLKQWYIRRSQGFAENPAIYAQFGMKGHNGIDIAYRHYTPVVAPLRLYISWTEHNDRGYGNAVWAETDEVVVDGVKVKLEMVFGHLDSISVPPYTWVDIGRELGKGDDTGFSSGHHLHFGIRPFIFEGGVWKQMLMNNGYAGYTEVEPFLIQKVRWTMGELLDLTNNTMIFYKEKGNSAVYQKGKDGKYYPINSGETFKRLYGEFADNQIQEVDSLDPKAERLGLVI